MILRNKIIGMDSHNLLSSLVDGNGFSEIAGSSGLVTRWSFPATSHEDPEGIQGMLGFHPYFDIQHN